MTHVFIIQLTDGQIIVLVTAGVYWTIADSNGFGGLCTISEDFHFCLMNDTAIGQRPTIRIISGNLQGPYTFPYPIGDIKSLQYP